MSRAPDDEVNSRLSAAVRRHSPMPLHHQIKVAVLEGVEQGWLEPGAQLPRERELAQTLGVSLAPVRQAMADLTREGYVDRIRGRGSFVRDRKLVEKIQILGSFHQSGTSGITRLSTRTCSTGPSGSGSRSKAGDRSRSSRQ